MNERPTGFDEFLSHEEQIDIRGQFGALVERTLYVGDPDAREKTRRDMEYLGELQSTFDTDIEHRSVCIHSVKELLQSSSHTTYVKICAAMKYVDFTYQHIDPSASEFLSELVRTEPESAVGTILLGAMYGRFVAWEMSSSSGQTAVEQLDRDWFGMIQNKTDAEYKLRVQAVSERLNRLFTSDEFYMRLPVAQLASEYTTDQPGTHDQYTEGIPTSVIFLNEGRLMSQTKLEEAVKQGVPEDVGPRIPKQRLPRLLAGVVVEKKGRSSTWSSTHMRGSLVHVGLRGLREQHNGGVNWQHALLSGASESFSQETLLRHSSFDTLSFYLAVRLIRKCKKELEGSPRKLVNNTVLLRWIDTMVGNLAEQHDTYFLNTESILSLALRELHQVDELSEWGVQQSLRHIKNQAIGLVVRKVDDDGSILREEEELWELYRKYVLEVDLTVDDKVELMTALLQNMDHPIWEKMTRKFPDFVQFMHPWVMGNRETSIPQTMIETLISYLPEYLVLRCETIRDTHHASPIEEHHPDTYW